MEVITGTIIVARLLFSIGLIAKVRENPSALWGVILYLSISATYLRVHLIRGENWEWLMLLNPFLFSYLLLFLPLLYLYVNRVLNIPTRILPHLLPFLLHFAFQLLRFTSLSEIGLYHSASSIFKFAFLVQAVFYGIQLVRTLRKNDTRIENQYSNVAGLKLNWMKSILLAIVGCGVLWLIAWISFLVGSYRIVDLGFVHISVLLIAFFLYNGMFTQRPVIDLVEEEGTQDASALPRISLSALSEQIQQNALYQDPELNLKKLAAQLSIPMREISQVINRDGETNFHTYINSFRVDHVKNDLVNPSKDQWTILALALDAGFNSKSTFNAVFRKHVGMTPIQFKQAQKTAKKE